MNKYLLLFLFIFLSIYACNIAYAHPFIVSTEPAQSSNVPTGLTRVTIYYSELVEQDFSTIKVFDSSGAQVDNKDTKYFKGQDSLYVTTNPLEDGVYTVTTKVLSRVDGHVVDEAFVFAVGNAVPPPIQQQPQKASIYFPEAIARFPGLVGQTVILGAVVSSLLIWNSLGKTNILRELWQELQTRHSLAFLKLTGVGMVLVLGSNIAMLAVQMITLETSVFEAISTGFGTTWLVRMIITIILFIIWFWMERKHIVTKTQQLVLLGLSLILISTTTMFGHGAASMQTPAIILDYAHNLLAAIWIGGVIYTAFVAMIAFASLESKRKESASLMIIPRISSIILIAVGILIITGPTLLWFLESNVNLLYDSTYGKLILAKIFLGSVMVAIGGYNQFRIQKPAQENFKSGAIEVYKKFKKSLRVEAFVGIILLLVVALLSNSSLPAGEIQQVQNKDVPNEYRSVQFSNAAKFDIKMEPFSVGTNTITVSIADLDNKPIEDISEMVLKISNPQKNISPIDIKLQSPQQPDKNIPVSYIGNATFGFPSTWHVEISAMRTQAASEGISFDLEIKPSLEELKADITEYDFPDPNAAPLYPLFDGKNTLWISDTAKPRLWKFDIAEKQFKSFEFDGQITVTLGIDNEGKIWYTDTPNSKIGFFEPTTEKFETIDLPIKSVPVFIQADLHNNMWIALADKNILLKYDQIEKKFEEFKISAAPLSGPTALILDNSGRIWFTESQAGKIGFINPETKEIKEFVPNDGNLSDPTALFFDKNGNLWISEHTKPGITKFDPILESFESIPVLNKDSLPFGLTSDEFGNIWFAQHSIDSLGIYDSNSKDLIEIPIPTLQSRTQFLTTDNDGNIWFLEQLSHKLGSVSITFIPKQIEPRTDRGLEIRYAELVSPLIAAGIIATSLFFVKSIKDKRRISTLLED